MEEKLSDRICREAFTEYYTNENYIESIKISKRIFRLLMKNDNKNSNDNYYIWMILMVIIKSYDNTNQIELAKHWILLSLRISNQEWMNNDSLYYLVKYHTKTNNRTKTTFYFRKCVESCNKINDFSNIIKLIEYKFEESPKN